MKNPIDFSRIREALPVVFDATISIVVSIFKFLFMVCALTGLLYMAEFFITRKKPEEPAQRYARSGYMNIILDDSRLVRCRAIDRSQPSCTLISECEDEVDRCVVTFEILRRPAGASDYLPTETED